MPQAGPSAVAIPDENADIAATQATLLIVEDNSDLREYLRVVLSDYRVLAAENGKEAIEMIERLTENNALPDLIMSDLMMPVMDGFQFLEHVKSKDHLRHIPFIMLTARADIRVKWLRALRTGVDDYLLKPFEEEELLARIQNLLLFSHQRSLSVPEGKKKTSPSLSDVDAKWLKTLEAAIETQLGDPRFSSEFLAHAMNLSSRQVQRRLQSATGLTVNQYIQEARLQRARHLLESDGCLVKQAAAQVGFKDAKYFSALYRERFGKSPANTQS